MQFLQNLRQKTNCKVQISDSVLAGHITLSFLAYSHVDFCFSLDYVCFSVDTVRCLDWQHEHRLREPEKAHGFSHQAIEGIKETKKKFDVEELCALESQGTDLITELIDATEE